MSDWYLLGVKQSLSCTQIGYSTFPTSIPAPFTWESSPGSLPSYLYPSSGAKGLFDLYPLITRTGLPFSTFLLNAKFPVWSKNDWRCNKDYLTYFTKETKPGNISSKRSLQQNIITLCLGFIVQRLISLLMFSAIFSIVWISLNSNPTTTGTL